MRPRQVVILEVLGQDSVQVIVVQHNHVVQALSAYGADQSLHVRILPRRAGRNEHFLNPHVLDPMSEVLAVDAVTVSQQESGSPVVWERLSTIC